MAEEEVPADPERDPEPLPEEYRKKIFLALVQIQDAGTPVPESRGLVAKRFGLTEDQVREVERQGLDGEWPPLE